MRRETREPAVTEICGATSIRGYGAAEIDKIVLEHVHCIQPSQNP